jgi:processive 1,2-diacylglycerol beta-glucosyltransferase
MRAFCNCSGASLAKPGGIMASTCDLLTVFTPVGGGHKAAALALCEAARARGLSAESRDIFGFGPRVFGEAYLAWHLNTTARTPNLYGSAYFGSNSRGGAFEPLRLTFDRVLFRKILREVERLRPRAIVATHHIPLVVLGRARRKGLLGVPLVGVVTDYTAHAVWAERGVDVFCTAAALPTWELETHGVSPERIVRTGIPVRPAFERIAKVSDPAPGEPLRVLVTSGGFGVGPLRAIARSCAAVPDVALTVVCGASEELRARVASDLAGTGATVLGFERDMPARVADAHVVVGKAGGLTVSETLTAGRPMIIIGAVPGNEKLNEDFVTAGGAGFACEPDEVGARLASMRTRRSIAAMGARGRRLVRHQSAERILGVCGVLDGATRAA